MGGQHGLLHLRIPWRPGSAAHAVEGVRAPRAAGRGDQRRLRDDPARALPLAGERDHVHAHRWPGQFQGKHVGGDVRGRDEETRTGHERLHGNPVRERDDAHAPGAAAERGPAPRAPHHPRMEGRPAAPRRGQAPRQGGDAAHPRRPQQGRLEWAPHVHRRRRLLGGHRLQPVHRGPPADVPLRNPRGELLRRRPHRVHEKGRAARHAQGCCSACKAGRRRPEFAAGRAFWGGGPGRGAGCAHREPSSSCAGRPLGPPGPARTPLPADPDGRRGADPAAAEERALSALYVLGHVAHGGRHTDLQGARAAPREARRVPHGLLREQPFVLHGAAHLLRKEDCTNYRPIGAGMASKAGNNPKPTSAQRVARLAGD
mmetsp:Transcript_59031/g.155436  ORF Transcript_59031/g.155436 Transcript_59031/m.155436 type:complete len:372 (-) Transcript_59031:159-1274(-)